MYWCCQGTKASHQLLSSGLLTCLVRAFYSTLDLLSIHFLVIVCEPCFFFSVLRLESSFQIHLFKEKKHLCLGCRDGLVVMCLPGDLGIDPCFPQSYSFSDLESLVVPYGAAGFMGSVLGLVGLVSQHWFGEIEHLICNYFSVATCKFGSADLLSETHYVLLGWLATKQEQQRMWTWTVLHPGVYIRKLYVTLVSSLPLHVLFSYFESELLYTLLLSVCLWFCSLNFQDFLADIPDGTDEGAFPHSLNVHTFGIFSVFCCFYEVFRICSLDCIYVKMLNLDV